MPYRDTVRDGWYPMRESNVRARREHPRSLGRRSDMAKGKGSPKSPPKYRRADDGRYTTPGYAKKHPKTTVKESK